MSRQSIRGFTFIEMMIVIVILGIIVGISAPRMKARFASAQVEDYSYRLKTMLNYAWQRSLADRQNIRIHIDASKKKYWLAVEQKDGESVKYKIIPGRFGRVFSFPEEITIVTEKPYYEFTGIRGHDIVKIILSGEEKDRFVITSTGRFESIRAMPAEDEG